MAVDANINVGQIRGAGQVCWQIGPRINVKVEDEMDELDVVEVHYEEIHEPQEPMKEIVPNTSSYNHNNVKCSFDYKTGFGAFVDRTVESNETIIHRNKYYNTFLYWINQQADDTDKMLLAFSKNFQSIEYLLEPPSYATGKLNFTRQLPNCETLNCFNTIKNLSMLDSNTAMWRLKLKEKETGNLYIDKTSGMLLRPLNETAPQISEPICDLLIHGKHHDPTPTCLYYDVGANHKDLFDSCRLNMSQKTPFAFQKRISFQ
uniref:Uncharacterized protein n=1 Tax=Romanomermis culicivorax TaxID=13658 RepID=A0A915JL50_ROMCU